MDATDQIPEPACVRRAPLAQNYSTCSENWRQEMWNTRAETTLFPKLCKGTQIELTGALQSIEVPGDLREIADIARRFGRV